MRISDWSSDVCSSDLIGQGVTRPTLGGAFQQGFKFVMGHDHHAIHQMGFVHLLSFQIWSALLSALCTAGCSATQVISTCSPRGRTAITRASRPYCRSEEPTSELQSLMRSTYAV